MKEAELERVVGVADGDVDGDADADEDDGGSKMRPTSPFVTATWICACREGLEEEHVRRPNAAVSEVEGSGRTFSSANSDQAVCSHCRVTLSES